MSLGDAFWIFVMLVMLQPVLKQRLLDASRQRLIEALERKRGSRVILLVHRQETMAFLGFPVLRYIDICDSEAVLRALQMTDPDVPIDLLLHTPGGLVLASLQIARAINHRKGKVTVYVPHLAMSGGTLIALAADEIVMSPHAVLGPVDPQIQGLPAGSLLKVVEQKPVAEIDDQTLILADQAGMAIRQVRDSVVELLEDNMPRDKAEAIAEQLSKGQWTHDHPITAAAAREIGLPVSTGMPEEFLQLLSLYPQPVRCQHNVEYVHEPRRGHRSSRPVA